MKDRTPQTISDLKMHSQNLRRHIIRMLGEAGSGHPGGSLSAADIVSCLYFWEMNVRPAEPAWADRDRFVLSKGHAAPVLYAVLAEKGYFPMEELSTLRKLGSRLQGHPDTRKLPGVEASTGSLGQGISWSVGMALAAKMDRKDYRTYVLLGDGEMEEGMVWEALMAAAHYRLDNLVAFVDNNGLQIDGPVRQVMNPEPLADKLRAFGWETFTIDGHDIEAILDALDQARMVVDKPVAIVARTVKGMGCSFMENKVEWHGTALKPAEVDQALQELA